MGVSGFTPFLQKTCPEVIKHLPERFRGLTGKTLVIDGTLITQRFHYAQAPHRFRHVLGWYRLVKELKDSGVSAICVFDGKERNRAKAREAERRREVQRQTTVRGNLEQDRSKRLRKLSSVLTKFDALEPTSKERIIDLIHSARREPFRPGSVTSPMALPGEMLLLELSASVKPDVHDHLEAPIPPSEFDEQPLNSNLIAAGYPPELSFDARSTEIVQPSTEEDPFHIEDHWPVNEIPLEDVILISPQHADDSSRDPSQEDTLPNTLEDDELCATLRNLYQDYEKSISLLASMATQFTPFLLPAQPAADPDAQANIMVSKTQYQLSVGEGRFWDEFLSYHLATDTKASATLEKLSRTSEVMCESFQRRMNPPTYQTYQECKEILDAMGVPCVETTGAFEGEALASSIVRHGLADYVASEDTDVLVYEAPLVRNLTNRQVPLMVVSGSDVRTVLQLDRNSFIDFALLLGTDFSQRIKNVGPARALKFIREYGSIERVIESETKYAPRISQEAYLHQVSLARTVFKTLPPVPEKEMVTPGLVDEDQVIKILQRYGLGRALAESSEWDYTAALEGNFFADNPSAQ